jgi:hypothetical protein
MPRYWVGVCDSHNWEGHLQDAEAKASRDLEEHELQFPDEEHEGARVVTRDQ